MNWHYRVGDRPKGPIPEEQFRTLVKAGAIAPDTLVWREGLSAWHAYGSLAGSASVPEADLQTVWCAECGKLTAKQETIRLEGYHICAACKPDFVQKMKEGILLPRLGVWRHRRLVILSREGRLADRCALCNAPASHSVKRKLRWYPQWMALVFLCLCLPLSPLLFFLGRRATVEFGLCQRHHRERRLAALICGLSFLAAIVMMYLGIRSGIFGMILAAIAVTGLAIAMGMSSAVLGAARIDERFLQLYGADSRFLKSLPPWPERQ